MTLSAGDRNVRIRFERATETQNPGGGMSRAWGEVVSVWAAIERVRSVTRDVERAGAGGELAQPLVRIHVDAFTETRSIDGRCRAINRDTGEVMDVQGPGQDLGGDGSELFFTAIITGMF